MGFGYVRYLANLSNAFFFEVIQYHHGFLLLWQLVNRVIQRFVAKRRICLFRGYFRIASCARSLASSSSP